MAAENFELIIKELQPVFTKFGFSKVKDAGEDTAEGVTVYYTGKKGTVKVDYANERIGLHCTENEYTQQEDAYEQLTVSLLDESSELSDVRFIAADFTEMLEERFGKRSDSRSGKQKIQTVSKAAVKNGSSYDPITLANKLALIFPQFKPAIKENLEKYDKFLPEDFFTSIATPVIMEALKGGDDALKKKIFGVLNEMYLDGTNQVQSLIVVTILGRFDNNTTLIAECIDYMAPDMVPQVIEVNKFLATRAGKKAQKKLDDPLKYKCKKPKQGGGLLSSLMGGGSAGGLRQ